MKSFFGEQDLKDAVVQRVAEHERLDQIIQGTYWDGSKGCGIGCVLHSHEHMAFERQLGLPVFLAYLDEHIFESLPSDEAKNWPLRFAQAIPVGVDLDLIYPQFMHWLLSDPQGVRAYANPQTVEVIEILTRMYARRTNGELFNRKEAESVRSAAWSAARSAAESAESAAESAAYAAWSAAYAAACAAESAAESAESVRSVRSASWSAACAARSARSAEGAARRAAEIHRQADYLIALLQSHAGGAVKPVVVGFVEDRHPWLVAR